MKIVLTGGTGFIGSALVRALCDQGHVCAILTRHPPTRSVETTATPRTITFVPWTGGAPGPWEAVLAGADAVINLAGEGIATRRWTTAHKECLRQSRLEATQGIVRAMGRAEPRPRILLSASAMGYYGDRGDTHLPETVQAGQGFLADLAQAWESAAQTAEGLGVRVVRLRIGLVLGPGGGALVRLLPLFRLGLGGPIGRGLQWISWIHRDDVVGLIALALDESTLRGPLNVASPNPVTNREFAQTLGHLLHRPACLPVPTPLLRAWLGERADLLLQSQRLHPAQALAHGYPFRYPTIGLALHAILEVTSLQTVP